MTAFASDDELQTVLRNINKLLSEAHSFRRKIKAAQSELETKRQLGIITGFSFELEYESLRRYKITINYGIYRLQDQRDQALRHRP